MKETVLNFGPASLLVGVLTRPAEPAGDPVAVVILNAGVIHRVGPNRLHVRLARSLARAGIVSLRIDLPGVGDSRGLGGGVSLMEEAVAGIKAAFDVLERHGVAERFVLFGLCSGADHAFVAAGDDLRVVGIATVDPTRIFQTRKATAIRIVRWGLKPAGWYRLLTGYYRITDGVKARLAPRSPASAEESTAGGDPEAEKQFVATKLSELVERGVLINYMITGEGRHEYKYRNQLVDAFPGIGLERVSQIHVFKGAHHTFTREVDRLRLETTVADWVAGSRFPESA